MRTKPTLLITGGSGFLGMHLANKLNKTYRIVISDISAIDPAEYPTNIVFVKSDVRNRKALEPLIKQSNYVIHAAAALPLWKKEDIFSINVDGTKNVVELVKKYHIKRLVYISSTAVYGVPEKHPIEESDPTSGVGPYGQSKIQAEAICMQACLPARQAIKNSQSITILRPKTFVGTGRLGVFEILFDWIHDGKRIPVIGTGTNRYQLLDVDDLVYAIEQILKSNKKSLNNIFNIGAASFATVKEDLQELFAFAKSGSKILPLPAFLIKKALFIFEKLKLSPLYQWVYDTADKDSFVSIEKLEKALGWQPQYSNSQALIKAYKWYRENYDKIKSQKSGITHRTGWDQGILKVFKKIL